MNNIDSDITYEDIKDEETREYHEDIEQYFEDERSEGGELQWQ